jgi:hypothetical protein
MISASKNEAAADLPEIELQPVADQAGLTRALQTHDPRIFPVVSRSANGDDNRTNSHHRPTLDRPLLSRPRFRPKAGDVVLASPRSIEEAVARRYALVTRRRFLPCSLKELPVYPGFAELTSVTAFCGPELSDLPRLMARVRQARRSSNPLRLGIITTRVPDRWSEVAARQLVDPAESSSGEEQILFVGDGCHTHGEAVGNKDSKKLDGASLAAQLERHHGTIFVTAHSRPHCGILPAQDGDIGLCGAPSGGDGGLCVHETACLFADRPRLSLRKLQCARMFFNGCTTAALGSAREAFLPPAALITHAVSESGTINYIGNDRAGHFDELDQLWFLAASALGMTPAEATIVVDGYRCTAGHESEGAAVLFGDALSPPWPTTAAVALGVRDIDNSLRLDWPEGAQLVTARLSGKHWGERARRQTVSVRCRGGSLSYAGIVAHPWDDASLIIAVRHGKTPIEAIHIERKRTSRRSLPLGSLSQRTAQGLRHTLRIRGFDDGSVSGADQLSAIAAELQQFEGNGDNLSVASGDLYNHERRLVGSAESAVLRRCLDRAADRWGWHADFAQLEKQEPAALGSRCPACGSTATSTSSRSLIEPRFKRMMIACGFCGVVSNWPWPDLRVRLTVRTASADVVEGVFGLVNGGNTSRNVRVGLALRGALSDEDLSQRTFDIESKPRSGQAWRYRLVAKAPSTGLMQLLLFAVVEGRIGVRSRMIFVGGRNRQSRGHGD